MINWHQVIEYANGNNPQASHKVNKSDAEWKQQLAEDVYFVTRKKGTERAFSSSMCNRFEPGLYACACCGTELFNAQHKFDSGTGWPSFTAPTDPTAIAYLQDNSHGMQRVETVCNVCDAHLGHVFPDGPEPTGLRYCINALSLQKVAES